MHGLLSGGQQGLRGGGGGGGDGAAAITATAAGVDAVGGCEREGVARVPQDHDEVRYVDTCERCSRRCRAAVARTSGDREGVASAATSA